MVALRKQCAHTQITIQPAKATEQSPTNPPPEEPDPVIPPTYDNSCHCDRIANVQDFGATGNGIVDDRNAIQAAVDSIGASGGTIYFPKGIYRLTQAIVVRQSRLTFEGSDATIVTDPAPNQSFGTMGALLVNRTGEAGIEFVADIWVRKLSFRALGGPVAQSTSVIQINACHKCLVEDVDVGWGDHTVPIDDRPRSLDGITFGRGSTGTIRRATVDSMTKVGIYIAGGTGSLTPEGAHNVLVEDCTITNSGSRWVAVDPATGQAYSDQWGFGVSVSASYDIVIQDVISTGHLNNGLVITTNGSGPDAIAAEHVSVLNSEFSGNGSASNESGDGVVVGSGGGPGTSVRPSNIGFFDVVTEGNFGSGVSISAGNEVEINNLISRQNGYHGLAIFNTTTPRVPFLTAGIHIAHGTFASNSQAISGGAGILLRGPDGVSISNSVLEENPEKQNSKRLWLMTTSSGHPSNIQLKDLDVGDRLTVEPGASASSGIFDLTGIGDPNLYLSTGLFAPPGSTWSTETGKSYVKESTANSPTGWSPTN